MHIIACRYVTQIYKYLLRYFNHLGEYALCTCQQQLQNSIKHFKCNIQ